MDKLLPCPFCGGEIDEQGAQCNYGKKTMILNLRCEGCGTVFKFKSKWTVTPYLEAIEAWNRRVDQKGAEECGKD